ncbi:MAG: hypothetical protein C0514_01690 [Candidatus Puniceispirillum sp.]|nr:hypothetical protein [Candidatus Puniceispirillum sp.]
MRTTLRVSPLLLSLFLSACADRTDPPAPVVHGDERRNKTPKAFEMPKEVYKPPASSKSEDESAFSTSSSSSSEVSDDRIVLREHPEPKAEEESAPEKIVLRAHKDEKKQDVEDSSFEDEILGTLENVPDKKKEEKKKDLKKEPLKDQGAPAELEGPIEESTPEKQEDTKKQESLKEEAQKKLPPQKAKKELPAQEEEDFFHDDTAPKDEPKGPQKLAPTQKEVAKDPGDVAPASDGAKPAASGAVRFSWPVTGAILKEFSQDSASKRNDGINIAAAFKTPVKAGRAGTVVYLGNDIKGFGNLILVKHDGPWMSAYAHLDGFTVAQGARLQEGQVLGYVGKSGGVKEPQLHFEVRKNSTPVNPRDFLG